MSSNSLSGVLALGVRSFGKRIALLGYTAGFVERVAARISATFLVVDVALTMNGDWIVIEINDGQDSGYAGNNPLTLWGKILDREGRARG